MVIWPVLIHYLLLSLLLSHNHHDFTSMSYVESRHSDVCSFRTDSTVSDLFNDSDATQICAFCVMYAITASSKLARIYCVLQQMMMITG